MPRANVANVTASAPKTKYIFAAICGLIAALLIICGLWTWHVQNSCRLQLERTCYSLEYAKTVAQREQGLSGRNGLPPNHAMLFVMPTSESACFWMKDMRFSLDIIWLDVNKKITKIEPNLSPDTYPHSYCSAGTAYALELEAGQAGYSQLKVGQQLSF